MSIVTPSGYHSGRLRLQLWSLAGSWCEKRKQLFEDIFYRIITRWSEDPKFKLTAEALERVTLESEVQVKQLFKPILLKKSFVVLTDFLSVFYLEFVHSHFNNTFEFHS